MRVALHPEARAELRAAAIWYDEGRPGLGDEFVAEVSAVLERVGDTPTAFPVWPRLSGTSSTIRRAVIDRFPYLVGFEVREDRVIVLAIAHARRRPLYWLTRAH